MKEYPAVATAKIKTHSTETFRDSYIEPASHLNNLLKPGFGKFFIVPVEELIRLIKLPVPPIRSTTHTIIYLTEGEATITVGNEFYKVHKNECLVVPAGQLYSFTKHDINKGYLCNFHSEMFTAIGKNMLLKTFEFLNVWGNPHTILPAEISIFVKQLFNRMLMEYSKNGLAHSELLQSYLIAFFNELNIAYKPLYNNKQPASLQLTNTFRQLLLKHIKNKHLVSEYAALMNISPNHLNKTIKNVTGKSPTKWIDDTIISEAKVLLYQTDFPIGEIAAEIGILDPSYFTRLFKKQEGITPLQFRKMIEMS
ncbi:MAG: helix-turn-helix domain-containing protein [Agriterribacter sp.]